MFGEFETQRDRFKLTDHLSLLMSRACVQSDFWEAEDHEGRAMPQTAGLVCHDKPLPSRQLRICACRDGLAKICTAGKGFREKWGPRWYRICLLARVQPALKNTMCEGTHISTLARSLHQVLHS